jgi:hypothetical protein
MSQLNQYRLDDIRTMTGDAGGAVSPAAGSGDLKILGGTNITTTGHPVTNDITVDLDATITLTQVNATTFDTNNLASGVTLSGTTLAADGTDAAININITPKGAGVLATTELTLTTDLAVQYGGTGASALTDNGILYGNGTAAIGATAELTNGQLLIGNTGNPPSLATLASAAGTIAITNAAGSINLETPTVAAFTGFSAWSGGAPYFDDTTLGSFTVSQAGSGYINGKAVSWTAPQTVAGLVAGNTYYIYIDGTGTIGKTAVRTSGLFNDNIVLFECLRDSTPVTNNQITVKENHPYDIPSETSNYLHDTIGVLIENINNGANITLNGTQKIQINGADELSDHGLYTEISDSGGVAELFHKMYTDGSGKWAQQNATDTFGGFYNNAGTPTVLGGSKFGIYRLYVSKDNLNAATPTYYAVLDIAEYNNIGAANTAIGNDTPAMATGELAQLELTQLGLIIFSQASNSIVSVIISKTTLRSTTSTAGTSTASLVNTNVASFNGMLSAADTNVQAALDTIDNWGSGTTDKSLMVGNGVGVAPGVISVGATGTILTGVTADDPTWTTATYPATIAKGVIVTATDTNVIGALASTGTSGQHLTSGGAATVPAWSTSTYADTFGAGVVVVATAANTVGALGSTGTAGQILTSGGAATVPAWTTNTYPATAVKGDILAATDTNIVGVITASANAGYVLTSNGAGAVPTYQANATGTVTSVSGGTNISTSGTAADPVVDLDASLTAMTDITFSTGGSLQTGTTATNTLLLKAYDTNLTGYVTFATLTANDTPTMDLSSDVTIGTNYIYRAGGTDIAIADGGTNASSMTNTYGVNYFDGTSIVTTTVGTTTQVLTSNGSGVAPTFQAIPTQVMTWTEVTDATVSLAANAGYVMNRGSAITATLPTTCAFGKTIRIAGKGAGLTVIAQNASQMIHFAGSTTTTGIGGSLTATHLRDNIELLCVVADLEFEVISSIGNWTLA